jgi:divalent metal cation (Fe/Co/Zn/Cd) transporter
MTGPESSSGGGDTMGAVVVAGVVNLAIALAKFVAGLLTGSAAMLSEAAHSTADTVTEVLLFFAGRSAVRPADTAHPLGFGRVSFAWALLASRATFVLGAGFSITHGMHELADGKPPTDIG